MSVVRSKICGITRIEDALIAAEAGADAIGLVFYAKSPRAVSIQQARDIGAALPAFVTTVGLFVNASREELNTSPVAYSIWLFCIRWFTPVAILAVFLNLTGVL